MKKNQKQRYSAIALLALFAVWGAGAAQRPNILFILADDLGHGDLGWTWQNKRAEEGKPAIKTPCLDSLALRGVRLTDHYAGSAVCVASRASLLTGQTQGHCKLRDNRFDFPLPNRITLASVMKQAGYATYAVGKWGVAGGGRSHTPRTSHPLDCGFDHFYGFLDHCAGHTYYHYDATLRNGAYMGIFEDRKNATGTAAGRYSTELFTARVKKYVIDHTKTRPDQPFFIYFAINAPHNAIRLEKGIPTRNSIHVPGGPYPKGSGLHGGAIWPLDPEPVELRNTWIDPRYRNLLTLNQGNRRARYATLITRMDRALGDLQKLLEDLKIDKKTLVIFTSDNGAAEGAGPNPLFFDSTAPFDGLKRLVYEGGIRVPTFAYWPGTLKPGVVRTPSAFWDWMPTFAELGGIPAPAASDGRSLLPDLKGLTPSRPSTLYFEYLGSIGRGKGTFGEGVFQRKGKNICGQQQMIRIGDYVALRSDVRRPDRKIRLYNVARDPHQDRDLAQDPAQAERVKAMTDALIQNRIPCKSTQRCYDEVPLAPLPDREDVAAGTLTLYPAPSTPLYLPDYTRSAGIKALERREIADLRQTGLDSGRTTVITGTIRVKREGFYTFAAKGKGAGHLSVHGARILDKENGDKDQVRRLPLKAGRHPITAIVAGPVEITSPDLEIEIRTRSGGISR